MSLTLVAKYRPYGMTLYANDAQNAECEPLPAPRPLNQTQLLRRRPLAVPAVRKGSERFELQTSVLLQFFPSGVCYTLSLAAPVVLGRGFAPETNILDLTDLNAFRHGVSRQHCLIWRRGKYLVVSDLDSTNGTYLNGELLQPHEEYMVADGDQLILGTLHATIFFSKNDSLKQDD